MILIGGFIVSYIGFAVGIVIRSIKKENWRAIKEGLGKYAHAGSCQFPVFMNRKLNNYKIGLDRKRSTCCRV